MVINFSTRSTSLHFHMRAPMMSFALIFSLIILASVFTFLQFPECEALDVPENESDKLSLLAFKSQINQDPLEIVSSWNESSHFCNWTGVTCGLTFPRLVSLNLTRQNLAGNISPHVGNFSFIRRLDLSGNFFTGEIPKEIGDLVRLRVLNMNNNILRGGIPFNLSNCSRLWNLDLNNNNLIGNVPPELGLISNLKTLSLGNNNLTGTIPSSLGNLTNLHELDMEFNYLSGEVPSAISQLKNLRLFWVTGNQLSGEFPPSLYNLTSLIFIALTSNNFTGNLRNDIGLALPNLQRFVLGDNSLIGPIPNTLSNVSKLQTLDLGSNNFTGEIPLNLGKLDLRQLSMGFNHLGTGAVDDLDIITSLTNCSNLYYLDLGGNRFGGVLPVSISNLSIEMTRLYLHMNSIHGRLPREISNLQNLQILLLYSNHLSGTIPDSLGMLPNLGVLDLYSNQFTGKIPPDIGNMTHMFRLLLHDNKLVGGIPSSLGNLKQMASFMVAQNNLVGTLPQEFFSISSLRHIIVSFNSLIGLLPQNVGNLSNLVHIDYSYNNFSGEIPNTLGDCLNLNTILFQGNAFQGRIPNLARLHNLQFLDLSRNNLSENIPDYLETSSSFIYLNISYNNLEGEVPLSGVFSNVSAIGVRGNSKLCGGIPELHLPVCPQQAPRKAKKKHGAKHVKLILIIVIPSSFSALTLFVLILLRKKRPENAPKSESGSLNFFPNISYEELVKATDGFSSENLIGAGGFGNVYKGTLTSDETAVAVKVLNLEKRGASKSFMAECRALRNIRHRNLVKVITACSSTDFHGNDFKALVYELMPNGSLDKWLNPEEETRHRYSLNVVQRIDIVIDVAYALRYLHHEGQTQVIHCDLKPHNVLLDDDFTAHIGDFGLARLFPEFITEDNANKLSSLVIKGTIGYAPPEYGMGIKASITGDIYSFGILLLEVFTGKRPTESLFRDNLNIRNFVNMAIPDKVVEVLDNSALCEDVTGEAENWEEGWRYLASEQRECLIHILQIGVACSVESPLERMNMRQVCLELSTIRDKFSRHLI